MADKRFYVLYDGRACGNQGTYDATCLASSGPEEEALEDRELFGCQLACYSYAIQGDTLTDEKWEWDYEG